MKFWMLIAAAACLSSGPVLAQKGESILFGDEAPSLAPLPAGQDQGDKCEQLLQEIDSLKGKPQRRAAAQQRYEAECRNTPRP